MNVSLSDRFTTRDAAELYGVDGWSGGYFRILDNGNLAVTPTADPGPAIDIAAVLEELSRRGVRTPVVLRFPQLLERQLDHLNAAFENSIREYSYPSTFQPVFPFKVNQNLSVIRTLLQSGWKQRIGLEVGSRPELLAATALDTPPGALLVCNGFKDAEYLSTAVLASRLGKEVVVVLEKPFELDPFLEIASNGGSVPWIGMRIRLQARGSGLWEKSGGFASKFGMSTLQVMRAMERLQAAGLRDRFAFLHFHVGSQITEIRKVKNAVREGARIYAKLRKEGANLRWLDVGGGLGVDYDGSRTSSDASVNYTPQEYANDVVYAVGEVCEQEHVEAPVIVSESGRMLTAYHSMVVTDVRAAIIAAEPDAPPVEGSEHQVVQEMAEIERSISVKNYRELYHDAVECRDQMYSLFDLGMLELGDRAKVENLFWKIAESAVQHAKKSKFPAEEVLELESKLPEKYICNFSVFQSLPDHWALDQLFPVMPIHRLNERPTVRATLVDITCDSDGDVEKFVDRRDIKESLEVHSLVEGQPYYLGFLLVGAYQDTMGDLHNLFGRVHEAEVVLGPDGRHLVAGIRKGDLAGDALTEFGYSPKQLIGQVAGRLRERIDRGELSQGEAEEMLEDYSGRYRHYTYLD